MLGPELRMSAKLLDKQEEKQFGDRVDWVIARSQKSKLESVATWIQSCGNRAFLALGSPLMESDVPALPNYLLFFLLSRPSSALTGMAQSIECQPANLMATRLIPSQDTCLGCRLGKLWDT